MNLKSLNEFQLIVQTKKAVRVERDSTLKVIEHLEEIERRSVHLKRGFSSLHQFLVKELGYCDGSAHRRISAMRLSKSLPEVKSFLEDGSLTLTNASKFQDYFCQKKSNNKEEKLELIEKFKTVSSKKLEEELVKLNPSKVLKKEVIKPVAEDLFKVELYLTKEEIKQLLWELIQEILMRQRVEIKEEYLVSIIKKQVSVETFHPLLILMKIKKR